MKYARFVDENVATHGHIHATGENVVSPYAKFEVVQANIGRGLVHIRSSYNNKFWVRWNQHSNLIVAGANEPEEDQSQWACTLFEPLSVTGNTNQVRLRHVQLGSYVQVQSDLALSAVLNSVDVASQTYTVVDWASLLVLPKHIAFKGDNGNYLSVQMLNFDNPYLQFIPIAKGDTRMWFVASADGHARSQIMSFHNKNLWQTGRWEFWILANVDAANSTPHDPATWFLPVRVADNVIALRSLFNNNFCTRFNRADATNRPDTLNANSLTIIPEAHLELEELVLERSIYDVNFRLMDARIYSESILTMATGEAANATREPNVVELRFSFVESTSSTWNTTLSATVGVTTTFKSGVPFIAQGEITVSTEFTGAYEWGTTRTEERTVETTYTIVVPPMSAVSVRMLASRGSCDVPFSYYQSDKLYDGTFETFYKLDGIYTGVNSYDFRYETHERPLLSSEIELLKLQATDHTSEA